MFCSGKERFLTFGLADRVAKLSNNRHAGFRLRAYRCGDCNAWHVGSSIGRREPGKGYVRVVDPEAA